MKPYSVIQTNTGKISIGKKCSIGNFNVIASGDASIKIGDFVRIGPHVVILGSLRNYKDITKKIIDQGYSHAGVTIGNDVMIGAGVTILAGSNIGTGVIVGAGSVITKNIDPYKNQDCATFGLIGIFCQSQRARKTEKCDILKKTKASEK